jgi:hypothetical protein
MKPLSIDRRVPVAFIAALLLQAGCALWWAAEQGSTLRFHSTRIAGLEIEQMNSTAREREVLVRLTRMEERMAAQTQLLQGIHALVKP